MIKFALCIGNTNSISRKNPIINAIGMPKTIYSTILFHFILKTFSKE